MSTPDDIWNFRFIEEVEKYPILWKSNRKGFDESSKFEIWSDIAIKFGLKVADCIMKWEKLCEISEKKMKLDLFKLLEWDYYRKLSFLIEDKMNNLGNINAGNEDFDLKKVKQEVENPDGPIVEKEFETNIQIKREISEEISNVEVSKMKQNQAETKLGIKILNAVRNYPNLWNIESVYKCDQNEQSWSKIASETNINVEKVKKIYVYLYERFSHKIKKYCEGQLRYFHMSKWKYYSAAEFLIETIKGTLNLTKSRKKNGERSLKRIRPKRKKPQKIQPERTQPESIEPQSIQPQCAQLQWTQPQWTQPQWTQPQRLQPESSQFECSNSVNLMISKPESSQFECSNNGNLTISKPIIKEENMSISLKNEKKADDDYLFLLSLIPKMKKLSKIEIMELRVKIQAAVYDEIFSPKVYDEVSKFEP